MMNSRYAILLLLLFSSFSQAKEFSIDASHSFIEWRVQHLGFSWLYGRFDRVEGSFQWDENQPENSRIHLTIDMASVDSNHAERDKHLRSDRFLNSKQYPTASFVSHSYRGNANEGVVNGELRMHGVTKMIEFTVQRVGQGRDPWTGYRAGFIATITIDRRDFGWEWELGPESDLIELHLAVEGIEVKKHRRH